MQEPNTTPTGSSTTWLIARIGAVVVWTGLIIGLYLVAFHYNYSILDIVVSTMRFFADNPWSPLLYVLVYTVQPFAFLPSTVFTILAGTVFGFWPGFIYTIVGANLSATAVYATGRLLTHPTKTPKQLSRWVTPLHTRPFYTLLFMRLAYFPFDVTNIGAGLLKVAYRPFVLATFIGTIPAIATLTAFGASFSLETFMEKGSLTAAIDATALFISAALFVGTVAITEVVRQWQRGTTASTTGNTTAIDEGVQ